MSVEPATPQATTSVRVLSNPISYRAFFILRRYPTSYLQDPDARSTETKDRQTPAKKNRLSVQLDVPQEEDESGENGESASAGAAEGAENGQGTMSCSPPTESKIRQISQAVEDLTWKNMVDKPATPDIARPVSDLQHAPMDTEPSAPPSDLTHVEEDSFMPLYMRGENPPMTTDEAGEDEHAGEADPKEVPPDAQPEEAHTSEEHEDATPPSSSEVVLPPHQPSRQGSSECVDQDIVLERKMDDRSVSEHHVPQDLLLHDDSGVRQEDIDVKHATVAKRPRDDDTDDNPRLTKRPTPPPEEEESLERSSQHVSQTVQSHKEAVSQSQQQETSSSSSSVAAPASSSKAVRADLYLLTHEPHLHKKRLGSCHMRLQVLLSRLGRDLVFLRPKLGDS